MAVKPEIIKARLKVLFPKANLSTKRLDALAAKLALMPADEADDVAVDAILNQANDFNAFEEIAREDDRIRTLEAKANGTPPSNEPPKADPPKSDPIPADVPEWAKGLVEANKTLLEKVTAIESGKVTETKKVSAQQAFEKSEVLKLMKPELREKWLKRIVVGEETTEDEIATQVTDLETEYSDLTQSIADSSSYSGPVPTGGPVKGSDEKVIESVVDNFRI